MARDRDLDRKIRRAAEKGMPIEEICARYQLALQRVVRALPKVPAPPAAASIEPVAPPVPEPPAATPVVAPEPVQDVDLAPLPPDDALLHDYLRRVAQGNLPCPSLTTLGDLVGRGDNWAAAALQRLEASRHIVVERRAGGRRRIKVDGLWSDWSASNWRRTRMVPPASETLIDQARRHLMSRDHVVVGAGEGLYKINGRIRSADELIAMANRSLMAIGKRPLDVTAL